MVSSISDGLIAEGLYKKALKICRADPTKHFIAANLLEESASKGSIEALYALGSWYLHGVFFPKNYRKAASFFRRAARGNHAKALYDLGMIYKKGVLGSIEYEKAYKCFFRAALLDDDYAKSQLYRMHKKGVGTFKDFSIANAWRSSIKS